MTFAIQKNLANSKKIILFEIDIPAKNGNLDYLINFEPGIWMCTLAPGVIIPVDAYAVSAYYSNQLIDDERDVGSVVVFGVSYSKLYSLEELRLETEAFYYDPMTTRVYIIFSEQEKPVNYNYVDYISPGLTTGYSNLPQSLTGVYYNDVEYVPCVEAVPVISQTKDPLFFGVISFNGGSVTLNNTDGRFDLFKDLNIFNQPARLRMGFDGMAFEEFRVVYTGFVESYSWGWEKFTVKLNDPRKKLTTPLPKNKFNKTQYPDLNTDDVSKPKPICYGTVKNAPLLCVNDGNPLAGTFQFFLADTEYYGITSVSKVYLDGLDLGGGNWSVNTTTGIVSILGTRTVSRDARTLSVVENRGDITADFTGVNIHNSLAIIKDILYRYGNQEFTPTYFNTAEYDLAQSTALDVCVYIDEDSTIKDVIEDCCVASDSGFIVQDNGLYTARNYSSTRQPVRTIYADEFMNDPQINLDESKFLSSVTIKYLKDYSTDKFRHYYNNTYEVEVTKRYKGFKTKEIETILNTEAGALIKSERIMELSKLCSEVVQRTTKTQNIDLEIMDFVIASPVSRIAEKDKFGIYEVIGIKKNLTNFEVSLDLRFVKSYTPTPDALTYNGILWNHFLYTHKLYSQAGVF